jgi:hypothetical protein
MARLSKKRRMYLRRVSPCSYFTIARSMRVPERPIAPAKLLVNYSLSWSHFLGVLDRQTYKGLPNVVDCAVWIMIG